MMPTKKRRVFLAIPCSEAVRDAIVRYQTKWRFLPVRWIKPHNLHLTLIPPAYLTDDELVRMIDTLRHAVSPLRPFTISFERFVFAPPGKPARMIWLIGSPSDELRKLKTMLEEILSAPQEHRPLLPHITIARMRETEWRRYAPKPDAEESATIIMPVTEIAVMESMLKRGGAEYTILERIPLKN